MIKTYLISFCAGRSVDELFQPTITEGPIIQAGFVWISVFIYGTVHLILRIKKEMKKKRLVMKSQYAYFIMKRKYFTEIRQL